MKLVHAIPLAAALCLTVAADRADACGGFFCGQTPVVQTGEQIVFVVDHEANTVDATIQISYSGQAEDFAWLLPLQSAPSEVKIGSNLAFGVANRLTAPQFRPRLVERGCPQSGFNGSLADAAAAFGVDAGAPGAPPVEVLRRAQVGPYDSVVISSEDPAAVQDWLIDNGYRVTDDMMEAVVPYISKGDVLLALKLLGDSSVGDMQPIRLQTSGTEVCVPLRLTAIAAQDDMDVTVYVLSNQGRALPSNYFHVLPNFARLNWRSRGADYRQLMGAAADEAGGNAFTTEFAGSPQMFRRQIFVDGAIDLSNANAATNLGDFLVQLSRQGLFRRAETQAILQRNISDAQVLSARIDLASFWSCPLCFIEQLRGVPYDPWAALAEIEQRILTPDREAQALFDSYSYLTRMFTMISPEEMGSDPLFSFDDTLADVSNLHEATIIRDCTNGNETQTLVLDNGQTFNLDGSGGVPADLANAMPAALKIEQLAEGTTIVDHSKTMADMSLPTVPLDRGCTCDATGHRGPSASLGFFAVALLGLGLRRRC